MLPLPARASRLRSSIPWRPRASCSQRESRTAPRPSRAGGYAATSWPNAATTTAGRRISPWCATSAAASSATARSCTPRCAAPGRHDWAFADETFAALRRQRISPIVDLCHFGVPDWIGDFQNPDFPALFADYARAFAERFPWVQLYTPVNEMFITRRLLGQLWLVERAAHGRPQLCHRHQATSCAPTCWPCARSSHPPRCDLHPVREHRALPCGVPRRPAACRVPQRRALPDARPELRPPRGHRDVRVPDGQRHVARGVPLLPARATT